MSGTTFTGATLSNGTVSGCTLSGDHTVTGTGVDAFSRSDETTVTSTGAQNNDISIALPAGAMIIDVGMVVSDAIAINSAADFSITVGTDSDFTGAQICATKKLISASTAAAAGEAINVIGANGEGAQSLAFAAQAPLWSSAARTIYFRIANSANNVTSGKIYAFIRYTVVA
jgi:uncharacterized protein YjbI with pentapeptide repeats